ncbi:MAG: zinc/manganese transport system substrate-binding protein [Actinomycetota bacterium]|jgi:zinc/manganese transport system substrate-binding protein|nr:zinc/manganese transport system substrate-binding protein [Actinomycetota bacterium]
MIINSRFAVVLIVAGLALGGCAAQPAPSDGRIVAVGAENQYTSVIAQIGGRYVDATSVMSNPNTDPHTFEASARVASTISSASLVVQNGLGYDSFMTKIEAAAPSSSRIVISAQKVLGLPDSTRNPHLWYSPTTMPAVAKSITTALGKLDPAHRAYFAKNLADFNQSMTKWTDAITTFRSAHPGVAVATTEPVADYLLEAAGTKNLTPWALQAAIMNDTDPAPQDVAIQDALFTGGRVKVFLYNQQVTDSITVRYLALARAHHVPVVGVYETMPTDGLSYQTWMEAELAALDRAVTSHQSTVKL